MLVLHGDLLRRACIICLSAIGFLACAATAAAQPRFAEPTAEVIGADHEVQEALDGFHERLKSLGCFEKAVESLQSIAGAQYRRLIPQFIVHQIRMEDAPDTDVVEAMLPHYLIARMDITSTRIVEALLPYLGNDDSRQQRVIKEYFARTEAVQSDGPPNFSHYKSLIGGKFRTGKPIPRILVLYLFDSDIQTALLTMNTLIDDRNQKRNIRWAEHEVSDVLWKWQHGFLPKDQVEPTAKEALIDLADSRHWWVRLYVAETMKRHPPFQDEVVLEQFEGDTDDSVREIAVELLSTQQ